MKPGLKHRFSAIVSCLWNGHKPVLGTTYSMSLGRTVACVCCEKCWKVL